MIADLFFTNVPFILDKIAIVCDGHKITYAELANRVKAMSNWLRNCASLYGHIGISAPASIDYVAALIAAADAGVVLVPVSPNLPPETRNRLFKQCDVGYEINDFSEIPSYDGDKRLGHSDGNYLILTTSGSTGDPKPIVLTQSCKVARIQQAVDLYSVTENDRILAATPLYHSLALRLALLAMTQGATLVLMPRYSPERWIDTVREEHVSFTMAVSSQLKAALPLLDGYEPLRCLVSSSALLDGQTRMQLMEKLKCEFHECYGASEVAIVTNAKYPETSHSSVGIAATDVSMITAHDNEILVKSRCMFSGYYKRDDLTNAAMYGEYFRTGDLGSITNGYLHLLGRKKEIIITGGINVYPQDIEAIVSQFHGVRECACFALESDALGEIVAVAIVGIVDIKALKYHCARHLADYQQPREWIFMKSLPKNEMGKVMRRKLAQSVMEKT